MTDQSSRLSITNLRTTSKLIKKTASTFSSNLFTLIFLSLLLFSYRTFFENGAQILSSFIDRDPSLKSLLSRLNLAGRHHHSIHRRRPFLYLTRVGTLDDDFFSADDESDSPVFPKFPPNGSFVILHNFDPKFGYSDVVIDNGVKVPEIVRTGIQFKAAEENHSYVDNANNDEGEDSERSREDFNSKEIGEEKIVDLQFLVKGLELERRDAAALLKLMPFSIMLPWINGFEKEISGFLVFWMLLDLVVGFIFAVDAWVTVVDTRTGRELLKEGCYLISTMFNQAVQIKCYEEILCGSAARWFFAQVFGKILATLLQSAFEVYFMLAWLIFYFVARCKEADSDGRRFGRRELKGLIDGLR
ncbi:hypothetical protein SADUNF_Sadunf16G0080900 [Salix dunnii]|uniref:Uncharacterized protein n=1 Tax=Salix dunnii TaxID=1413687 RepID=A0A835J5P2_9ROSI|nr:hypothetical protein SADUNF_Sadunf16G0080900 [Salix dunnii]